MVMPKTPPVTERGNNVFEVLSALQKEIRRGNERDAMFWAVELESFNPAMLWNRLQVIASEDVGPANSALTVVIESLRRQYEEAREEKKNSYRLYLAHAVIASAMSSKSRIVDDLLNVVYGEIQHEDKKLPIPDYALDIHTKRGRMKGRSWDHFYTEASKLVNETSKFQNPYTQDARKMLEKYGRLKSESKKDKKNPKKHVPQKDLSKFAKKD
jgi:replication-associated recombination protein RarA